MRIDLEKHDWTQLMAELCTYEGFRLRKKDHPEPIAVSGWWRRRWLFEAVGGSLQQIVVPPPLGEMDPSPVVIASSYIDGGKIIVDSYSRGRLMSGEVLAYLSVVAAWIQQKHHGTEIVVNGERRHPIL